MKKNLLILSLILPIFAIGQSKELRTGTRLGFGTASYSSPNFSSKPAPKLYIEGGGILVYGLTNWASIRADLMFNYSSTLGTGIKPSSGFLSDTQPYTDQYTNFGFALPLTFRFALPSETLRPYVELGAMAQANLFTTEERIYADKSYNSGHGYGRRIMEGAKPLSYYAVGTLGVELHTSTGKDYFLEFRVLPEITDLGQSDDKPIHLSSYTIGGGILF